MVESSTCLMRSFSQPSPISQDPQEGFVGVRRPCMNRILMCFVGDFIFYIKRISKTGEWGDHVTLQAAADSDVLRWGLHLLHKKN